jgi:hypothetical protein
MVDALKDLAPAKLPPPIGPTERQLRARLARLTRSIRDAEKQHAALVQRHGRLVAERREVERQWREARRPQVS